MVLYCFILQLNHVLAENSKVQNCQNLPLDMILSQSSHLLYSKPVSLKHILFYLINFSAFHAAIFHRFPHHNSTCILHFPVLYICPLPHLPYTVWTNSVVQGLTWIASSFSAHQKIPCFYGICRILNVTYHPYNSVYEKIMKLLCHFIIHCAGN